MTGFVRRVVTGHDESGKSTVISDGFTPTLRTNPLRPGHRATDVWRTTSAPVVLRADDPDPTLATQAILPGARGTVLRAVELQPESEAIRSLTPEQARDIFKAMGSAEASTHGSSSRHPMMHRTETVDYAVVLEGELTLILDDRDVVLEAGDVVIQRGTNHAWANRSDKVCRTLFVLMDASFEPELAARLEQKTTA